MFTRRFLTNPRAISILRSHYHTLHVHYRDYAPNLNDPEQALTYEVHKRIDTIRIITMRTYWNAQELLHEIRTILNEHEKKFVFLNRHEYDLISLYNYKNERLIEIILKEERESASYNISVERRKLVYNLKDAQRISLDQI